MQRFTYLLMFLIVSFAAHAQRNPTVGTTPVVAPSSQAAVPDLRRAAAGTVFRDCADCPEMVMIAPGRFTMGSPDSEAGRYANEGPQRSITIASAYAVGRFEVTRAQYARFARETSRAASAPGCDWANPYIPQTENEPVVCVSWEDAKAYAQWLRGKTGRNYRLLTEAEWEYAARAGTAGRRYWGENDTDACRYANVADAGSKGTYGLGDTFDCRDNHAATAPAGSFPPNTFGVYDMLGNVWEWTEDCWGDYTKAPTNGSASSAGDCSQRALRGGSWFNNPRSLRAASRIKHTVGYRDGCVGFRVARTQ